MTEVSVKNLERFAKVPIRGSVRTKGIIFNNYKIEKRANPSMGNKVN